MKPGKYTVRQITEFLRKELTDYYSQHEIQQFIFLALEDKMGFSRIDMITKSSQILNEPSLDELMEIAKQLKDYKPIQYILGWTEFYGLKFSLTADVLIPRPETEELVDWILKESLPQQPKIIDIGTGSGCIAVTLGKNIPSGIIEAIDISEAALKIALGNARSNHVEIIFHQGDILAPSKDLKRKKFDLIVSNPPYVTQSEKKRLGKNVIAYEPHLALFVTDEKPLIYYEAILRYANHSLEDEGLIYFEIHETFHQEIVALMKNYNFADIELRKDIHEKFRMIKGRKSVKAIYTS